MRSRQSVSGTGTINLAQHGMNFCQLNIGTSDLSYISVLIDTSHTLVIEYVRDTGPAAVTPWSRCICTSCCYAKTTIGCNLQKSFETTFFGGSYLKYAIKELI